MLTDIQIFKGKDQEILIVPGKSRNHRTREIKTFYFAQGLKTGRSITGLIPTRTEVMQLVGIEPDTQPTRTLYDVYFPPEPEPEQA